MPAGRPTKREIFDIHPVIYLGKDMVRFATSVIVDLVNENNKLNDSKVRWGIECNKIYVTEEEDG